jgi:DNA-binding transcriptional regulator YbjK
MVTPRAVRAADAAIEVIAEEGLRGLTHRAVDARADLPPGSTSGCYRTRLALLKAVLERIVELDEVVLTRHPIVAGDAVGALAAFTDLLEYWLGPGRQRTRARLKLYLDAARHPDLRPHLERARAIAIAGRWGARSAASAGSDVVCGGRDQWGTSEGFV